MKVYHKDAKVFIEMSVQTAQELRYELSDLTGLAEDYIITEELYNKLYYQTQN